MTITTVSTATGRPIALDVELSVEHSDPRILDAVASCRTRYARLRVVAALRDGLGRRYEGMANLMAGEGHRARTITSFACTCVS